MLSDNPMPRFQCHRTGCCGIFPVQGRQGLGWAKETELPNHITVNTNGTFKVGAYSPRSFADGQVLAADGMLTSPDGKLAPVIDHVVISD